MIKRLTISVLIALMSVMLLTSLSTNLYAFPDFNARVLHSSHRSIQHRLSYHNTIDSIYIDNSGDENLEWELELVAEGNWISINSTEGTVEPNGRNWVVVTQNGSDVNEDYVTADLNFTSNDPTRREYNMPVIGWKINYPRIDVSWPEAWGEWWGIDMNNFIDNLEWGNEYEFEITITNRWGGARLEVEDLPCNNGYFTFEPTEFSVNNNNTAQVTVTFTAEEVGYHTATITSVSNAWDPQELAFRIVCDVASIFRLECPMPNIYMDEDDAEFLVADLDTVFLSSSRGVNYQVVAANGMNPRIERDGSFYISPRLNFFGTSDVIISASFQDSTLTDTFSVFVNPLPDPPATFDLIAPSDSAVIHPTEFDSLFIWQASSDPDGEIVYYDLTITNVENQTSITFSDLRDTTYSTLMLSEVMDVEAGGFFNWYVTARDSSHEVQSWSVFTNRLAPLGVDDYVNIPVTAKFAEAYPNPFNSSLNVRVNLKLKSDLAIRIFDMRGRMVSEIFNDMCNDGISSFSWNALTVPSGSYIVSIHSSDRYEVIPVTLSK
ncbi:T9SS type A sorting domain-containing protein [bacterium]|nr:T9SS type A sorting domain-containing protein [bacterium]